MATLLEIASIFNNTEYDDNSLQEYRNLFEETARTETPESISDFINKNPDSFFCIAPILTASLYHRERYQEILDYTRNIDLSGQNRSLDFFNGKLIKYFHLSLKHLDKPVDQLYRIMSTNKEYGNEYSIAITTNAILDSQINNHIYETIHQNIVDREERAKYCIYNGIISLIKGRYEEALLNFDEGDIINVNTVNALLIKKYTIITKLMLGDCTVFYPYEDELKPYFSLIGCVKRGDMETFYKLIEEYKEEYFKTNLYFVVRRLTQKIALMGLKKITVCYSRIRIEDISKILRMNAESLVYKTLKDGDIKGFIEEGVFYSQNGGVMKNHCGELIRTAIEVRKDIGRQMKYPEIEPLCFEKVIEKKIE